MTIIGFEFTKLHISKSKIIKGKINISNNVKIRNVEEAKLQMGDGKAAIKFSFAHGTNYEPEIGIIEIEGDVVYLTGKDEAKKILDGWKKEKTIDKQIVNPLLSYVLNKSSIEALLLSKEMGLPAPIPLPKVSEQIKASA